MIGYYADVAVAVWRSAGTELAPALKQNGDVGVFERGLRRLDGHVRSAGRAYDQPYLHWLLGCPRADSSKYAKDIR